MADLKDLVKIAEKYLGIPYVYGGTTPKGFDCSGFMQYIFNQVGIKLPRTSQQQSKVGKKVDYKDLSPGDLIFSNWGEGPASHVAMYVGKGKLIESPRPGKSVQVIAFNDDYLNHTDGYRRVTSKKGGVLDTVEGIAGDFANAVKTGAEDVGNGLLNFPGEVVTFFKDATSAMEGTVKFFSAFFDPSTYVRIGAGVLGSMFLMAGVVFLVMGAAKS